jgi:hypothetical protein
MNGHFALLRLPSKCPDLLRLQLKGIVIIILQQNSVKLQQSRASRILSLKFSWKISKKNSFQTCIWWWTVILPCLGCRPSVWICWGCNSKELFAISRLLFRESENLAGGMMDPEPNLKLRQNDLELHKMIILQQNSVKLQQSSASRILTPSLSFHWKFQKKNPWFFPKFNDSENQWNFFSIFLCLRPSVANLESAYKNLGGLGPLVWEEIGSNHVVVSASL